MEAETYVVRIGGEERRYDRPEEVSKAVSEYQMQHGDDVDLAGISVGRLKAGDAGEVEELPPQRFLPEQLP